MDICLLSIFFSYVCAIRSLENMLDIQGLIHVSPKRMFTFPTPK